MDGQNPPMGSAERELLRTGVRYTLVLRLVIVGLCGVVTLISGSVPVPAVTAVVVITAIGWNLWYALRFNRRGRWLVPVDVAVTCLVCAAQVWTVPAEVSAEGITWVSGVAGITVIAYAWQLRLTGHAAATLAVAAAFLAGAAVADPQGWTALAPVQLWMVVQAALSRALFVLVRRGARWADAAVAHAARARQEAAVARARRADERAYLAALHDTASATLLMVGAGVADRPSAWLSRQAARDLEVIAGRYRGPNGETDLVEQLREVSRGLPLTVSWDAPVRMPVPAPAASALAHCVREALTNVVRHSGVAHAAVSLRHNENTVTVEVSDDGVGFDPARVNGHRYGVTRSIVERMSRLGGRADVISRAGAGTTVRLRLTLTAPAPLPAGAGGDLDTISAGVTRGLRWSVVAMNLIILYGLELPKLLANRHSYQPLWTQFAALAALTGVTLAVAALLWRGRAVGRLRWPLAAVVFAGAVLATASVPPDERLGIVHWSEAGAAWTLVLLALDARLLTLVVLLVTHYTLTFAHTAIAGAAGISLREAVTATVIVVGYQLAVGIAAAVLRPVARSAAKVARAEEELRIAQAAAEQIHADRTDRYEALGQTTAPLLAGLAAGQLDPGDTAVRRDCAVEAARMRRLLAEDADAPDPLSHELRGCIELAERNGINVTFAQRGKRPQLPRDIRRALTDPAAAVLATAASKARVTVVGTPDEVVVSVRADAPADIVPTASRPEVDVSTVVDGDMIWIKTSWRSKP